MHADAGRHVEQRTASPTPAARRVRAEPRHGPVRERRSAANAWTLDTLVVNYDWDAVSLLSASNWSEMKRFSDQDITFLAEANFGVADSLGAARSQRGRAVYAGSAGCSRAAKVRSNGWPACIYLEAGSVLLAVRAGLLLPDLSSASTAGQDFAADAPLARNSPRRSSDRCSRQVSYDSPSSGPSASARAIWKTN